MDRNVLRAKLTGNEPIAPDILFGLTMKALDHGLEREAIARLREVLVAHPRDFRLWQALGLALREVLDAEEAHMAFRRAAILAPADPLIGLSVARTAAEAGLPASQLYANARRLAPANGDVILGECAALRSEGDAVTACARLRDILQVNPGWYAGHAAFARLSAASNLLGRVGDTIGRAITDHPRDAQLWRLLCRVQMEARDYQGALETATRAKAQLGPSDLWERIAANCLSETGEAEVAQAIFDRLPGQSAGDLVYPIRNLIRLGRYDAALALASRRFSDEDERILWPYRALLWRKTGDDRWAWLEGDERLVGVYDMSGAIDDLAHLTQVLREIHTRSGIMLDQSVRGGTQTDGHLFALRDPAIRRLRAALTDAVATHVAQLPAPLRGHPTLIDNRSPIRFSGAWSVRLRDSGYHVDHVHPQGWFSSAFYIAVPGSNPASDPDEATSLRPGWLAFGESRDLLPDFEGFRFVEPKPGRLVLFPSTMWHGTRPFPAGERMTVAFDVARP